MIGPDRSSSYLFVKREIYLYFFPSFLGICLFFFYRNVANCEIYTKYNYSIFEFFSNKIIPGSIFDISFVKNNRSIIYIFCTEFMFSTTSIYIFIICMYYVIITIYMKIIEGISLELSPIFHFFMHVLVSFLLLVWRTPDNIDGTLHLYRPDEGGLYFIKTGISMSCALFSISVLIVNTTTALINMVNYRK